MKTILREISEKDVVYGRFGKHNFQSEGPDWDDWDYHSVTYVQKNRKGEVVIVGIGELEFDHYQIEKSFGNSNSYTIQAENAIFEFIL